DLIQRGDPLTECRIWDVPGLAPVNYTSFHSAIPTLLLPGAFDPNTRPEWIPALAAQLGHAYLVPFPTYGHGAVGAGPCANSMVLDFLTDPHSKPDTNCVAQMTMAWP